MELDPRLHFLTVTGIVARKDESGHVTFLIAKRAAHEKAFPNKWTVPGGKLVRSEYEKLPYKTSFPQWYKLVEWVLRKEITEEVGVEIADEPPRYLTDLGFIRPDGYPVITLSYWAWYKSGEAKAGKDLVEVAWISAEEAKNYDLIDGIAEEIEEVEEIINGEAK